MLELRIDSSETYRCVNDGYIHSDWRTQDDMRAIAECHRRNAAGSNATWETARCSCEAIGDSLNLHKLAFARCQSYRVGTVGGSHTSGSGVYHIKTIAATITAARLSFLLGVCRRMA